MIMTIEELLQKMLLEEYVTMGPAPGLEVPQVKGQICGIKRCRGKTFVEVLVFSDDPYPNMMMTVEFEMATFH